MSVEGDSVPDLQSHFEGMLPHLAFKWAHAGKNQRTEADRGKIRERLFLAIMLDPALFPTVAKRAKLTCQTHGLSQQPINPERLHISLLGFGNYNDELATNVAKVAALVRFAPIQITLDEAMSFFIRDRTKHPFVLTSGAGLDDVRVFSQTLGSLFFGLTFKEKFNPHMTLVWDPKVISKYTLTKSLSWTAHEFALVRSYYGKSRYDIVGRWPLSTE